MSKFLHICLGLIVAVVFSACGEEDVDLSSEPQTQSQPAPVNKQAITFPELPSMNAPIPNVANMDEE